MSGAPWKARPRWAFDMAHRGRAFHGAPDIQAAARALVGKRHVVRRVEILPAIVNAGPELLGGIETTHQRLIDEGTLAAMISHQRETLHPPRPLLVHLRWRLDEVALDAGPGMLSVFRSG